MNYNNRCEITYATTESGYLGDEIIESKPRKVACGISSLSLDEQVAFFGKYSQTALKLHLKGKAKNIYSIKIDDVIRTIFSIRYFRNSTVVILS